MNKVPYARLIITASICILLTGCVTATHVAPSTRSTQYLHKKERQVLSTTRYYAAVVPFHSARTDVKLSELSQMAKSGKVAVALKDAAVLSQLLHSDLHTSAQNRPCVVPSNDGIAIIRVDDLTPNVRVCTVDGKSLWDNASYPLYATVQNTHAESKFDRSKIIRMTAVGDIILGRTVYKKMTIHGYTSPFANVATRLSRADITVGDLETPLSNAYTPPLHGMEFLAPKMAVRGLTMAGFDIVSLANNHSTNFGSKAFLDTLDILTQESITYTGGGKNEAEAKSYKVLTVKGKRFAFIGANSIIGDQVARGSTPGDWHISLAPWGTLNQREVDELVRKVKEARSSCDIVVVIPHWAQEYTRDPNPQMIFLAHQLVDAGADLIIGTHPHWVQGIEIYKNRFIAYSLGNFVFDQEWSEATKQGLILEAVFYQGKLINVDLLPTKIESYHKPRILNQQEGAPILNAVWASSLRINKNFK